MCDCSYGIIKESKPTQMLTSGLFSSRSVPSSGLRDVCRRGHSGAERQGSGVIQCKTRLNVVQELTAEGVEVLPQCCVVEGEDPAGIIQKHTDPQRLHRDADVRRPAVVQELIFVPAGRERSLNVQRDSSSVM